MKRTKTFTVEYTYFEPGTKVMLTKPISGLEMGKVYTVTTCEELEYGDYVVCMLLHGVSFGVNADWFEEIPT